MIRYFVETMNDRLTYLSQYDALTGIYNRRKIEEVIEGKLVKAAEENRKVSLLMFDIDFFKAVNDTYGHGTGDSVLVEMTRIFRDVICSVPGGHLGRWGGEEFFAVIPDYDSDGAVAFAEKLRKRVEEHSFSGITGNLTISIGVITANGTEERQMLYKNVDDCLYFAKQNGRNQVVRFES